jgi:uncharacterized protein YecE (DUF72 family)
MIYIGTSGYNYPEWRGSFYPEGFPAKQMFGFYAERFRTVEINATFYRMPTAKLTAGWLAQSPDGFRYSLKAPRVITHLKRLSNCADSLQFFCDSARVLGSRLGVLLFQLPPNFKLDMGRLEDFVRLLPTDMPCAFEFRHESWLVDDVYRVLGQCNAALCIADFGDKTTPFRTTARHGYLRLRDEGYTREDLGQWASEVAARAREWDDVFVYFKHEEAGKGPEFARTFLEELADLGITPA